MRKERTSQIGASPISVSNTPEPGGVGMEVVYPPHRASASTNPPISPTAANALSLGNPNPRSFGPSRRSWLNLPDAEPDLKAPRENGVLQTNPFR